MGRDGKFSCKRNFKKRDRSKDKGSDDSDEDYMVEYEENESEDFGSSEGYASEESFGSFVEEEDKEEEEFRKVVRSKKNKGSVGNGKIPGKTSRKRKRVSSEEEEDEDYINDEDYDDDDDDYDDDDDDEEFTPDEDDDCLDDDDEEELTVKKKNNDVKLGKRRTRTKSSRRGRKRRRKSKVLKKPLAKKGRNVRRLRKKERCEYDDEDCDFVDNSPVVGEKSNKSSSLGRRRKYAVYSDSDFVLSGSSDHDYTISEEEREQVREASELFGDLKTSLRSSTSVKKVDDNGDLCQRTKSMRDKGKEKVKDVKSEVGKQVCGICLSDEDKRRFRGILNCCSHYFCFTCIMEWSKVESRCPLCKQRFNTITKNGRSSMGVDLRNMVIEVPKRDQVYQPSEEEIRSFIDPYENVICTECHEGGDDGLMLLCDLCDSPAHTYCVGLGQQVPEGNWYCDGCRPVALGSSHSQAQDHFPDHRTAGQNLFNRPSPVLNLGEGSDSILDSSSRLAFAQGPGNLSSPRLSTGDVQAASPVSGTGAPTLSVRRQIHRHIQNLLSHRMGFMASRTDAISASNLPVCLSNSQIDQGREAVVQNSRTIGVEISQHAFLESRLQANDHPSSSLQNRDFSSSRANQVRRQVFQDPAITNNDRSSNLTLWPGLAGINSIPDYEQFHLRNIRSGIVSDGNSSPYRVREEGQFYVVKEQLQSMVKSHLKSLSHDVELGHDTFKDIARSSTHTILAACGLDHKRSEVHNVAPPSMCNHADRLASGQTSIMKGFCSACFDSFVRDVVKRIMDTRLPQWLSLGL